MKEPTRKKLALLTCILLLVAFGVQGWFFIQANSQTVDEVAYLGAGYSHLARRDFRLMREHPPLMKELCALPVYLWYRLPFEPDPQLWEAANPSPEQWAAAETDPQIREELRTNTALVWPISMKFLYESSVPAEQILTLARLPNLFLGTLLVALVGWWSYRLWGPGAAVVGTALTALEPNLIAHSSLATTDMGVTFFAFLSVYLLWEYVRRPHIGLLVGVGLSAGLAFMSKFSGALVIALDCLILLGSVFIRTGQGQSYARQIAGALASCLAIVVLAGLVIGPVYFFEGTTTFERGFRWLAENQMQGRTAFFLGKYGDQGWWHYFVTAFLIKTPVGSLVLVFASLLLVRLGEPLRGREVLFLVLPATAFLVAATVSRTHIGLRYALPTYPFLFVLASRLATVQFRKPWATPMMLGIPLIFTALSVLREAPHQLAYFNELVGGPSEGAAYLSDSNIDWGQDLKNLKAYLDHEDVSIVYLSYFGTAPPEYYGLRYQYLPCGIPREIRLPSTDIMPPEMDRELLAISVVNLHGLYLEEGRNLKEARELFQWLARRKPIAQIGYSIYVYDITKDADAHQHLAEVYLKAGLPRRGVAELQKLLALNPHHDEAKQALVKLLFHRHQMQLGGLLACGAQGPLPCLPFLFLPGDRASP